MQYNLATSLIVIACVAVGVNELAPSAQLGEPLFSALTRSLLWSVDLMLTWAIVASLRTGDRRQLHGADAASMIRGIILITGMIWLLLMSGNDNASEWLALRLPHAWKRDLCLLVIYGSIFTLVVSRLANLELRPQSVRHWLGYTNTLLWFSLQLWMPSWRAYG